jgi:DNA adenine methylase
MDSAPQIGSGAARSSANAARPARTRRPVAGRHARPFLKWAGGKRQLLPELRQFYPEKFATYHEPFLGSGAVFFDLVNTGQLTGGAVRLTDVNSDLVGCWLRLRKTPAAVVEQLRGLQADHDAAPHDHYYRVRDAFNPLREAIMNGSGARAEKYTARLAAMFIYLNRTGYNGLFRLNSSGWFNVPRGKYKNPKICDEENLRRVSSALSGLSAEIEHASFERVGQLAEPGDFVYFDPPYAPMSGTARFTSYTAGGFGTEDQRKLQQTVFELVGRGCAVVLSNSTAPEIAALYEDNPEAKRLGIKAHTVPARRAINSNAARRGHVDEYIITNVRNGRYR